MHSHSSNENTFKDKVVGSIFWAGRHWLYIGRRTISTEWYFLHKARSSFSWKISWGSGDGDDGITLHACIPFLFSVWFSINRIFGKKFHYPNETRETGISYYEGTLSFFIVAKENSWSSRDKWYNHRMSFDIPRFIFGREKYTEENDSGWSPIVVGMPEGSYKGKIRLYTGQWKDRFRTRRIARSEIEMEEGIPFPGKGENGWDCGEDCTWGITCPASTEAEAIGSLVESVLRSRRNYGGWSSLSNYKPERKYIRKELEAAKATSSSCEGDSPVAA